MTDPKLKIIISGPAGADKTTLTHTIHKLLSAGLPAGFTVTMDPSVEQAHHLDRSLTGLVATSAEPNTLRPHLQALRGALTELRCWTIENLNRELLFLAERMDAAQLPPGSFRKLLTRLHEKLARLPGAEPKATVPELMTDEGRTETLAAIDELISVQE